MIEITEYSDFPSRQRDAPKLAPRPDFQRRKRQRPETAMRSSGADFEEPVQEIKATGREWRPREFGLIFRSLLICFGAGKCAVQMFALAKALLVRPVEKEGMLRRF